MSGERSTEQIRVAADGDLYVALFGATLPTNLNAPDSAFQKLGYLSDDGATLTAGVEMEAVRVWQTQQDARRIVTERSYQVAGQLAQWNRQNFKIAFGGGEWTSAGSGIWRYDPPADTDVLPIYSAIIDWKDGSNTHRSVIRAATITDEVETELQRGGNSVLPITINALTPEDEDRPWYYLTDDDEFAVS